MQQATKGKAPTPAPTRRLFRVKPGRALIFPQVTPDASNSHLWARAGEAVDATHPVLLAIVERVSQNVVEIQESELGESRLSTRMHPSIKAAIREHDADKKASKATKLAAAASEKAKAAGVDPATLPSLEGTR